MNDSEIREIVEGAIEPGIYEYGFADLSGLLPPKYARFRSGISLLRKLDDRIIDGIASGPTREYLGHYHSINAELQAAVQRIEEALKRSDIACAGIKPTFMDSELDSDYRKTLRTDISHKMVATRAGLGWIGKTDLFVSARFGPRVRLSSVLLENPLPVTGPPVEESRCGACETCVKSCPGRAASGREWRAGVDRNEFFDPFSCRDTCRRLSKERLNEEISLCGICVSVCPKGTPHGDNRE
jgi:epoxyqueuosine reductase QueG